MDVSVVVLGLSLQDVLGAAFGVSIIVWAVWCLYEWEIKPGRRAQRRRAQKHLEEMHRKHWEQLGIKGSREAKRKSR